MAQATDVPPSSRSLDRSERPGRVGLLLLLAGLLVGAAVGLSFVAGEQAQPLILLLLAILAMAGVFFLFATAIGALQFAGAGTRNDLTKLIVDTARDGVVVVEEDGRIQYANEAYAQLAGGQRAQGVERGARAHLGPAGQPGALEVSRRRLRPALVDLAADQPAAVG